MKTKQLAAIIAFALLLMPLAIAQDANESNQTFGGYYSNRPDPDTTDSEENHTFQGLNTRSTQEDGNITENTTSINDTERFRSGAIPDSGFPANDNANVTDVVQPNLTTVMNEQTTGRLADSRDELVQARTELQTTLTALSQCRAGASPSTTCDDLEQDFRVQAQDTLRAGINYLLLAIDSINERISNSTAMDERQKQDSLDDLDSQRNRLLAIRTSVNDNITNSVIGDARDAWNDAVQVIQERIGDIHQAELNRILEREREFADRVGDALDNANGDLTMYIDLHDALRDQLNTADQLIGDIDGGADVDARARAARNALQTAYTTLAQLVSQMNGETSGEIGVENNVNATGGAQ